MPRSGNNARPYNRNQRTLKGEPDPKSSGGFTRGRRAQIKRQALAKTSANDVKSYKASKARAQEDTPSRARTSLMGMGPGKGPKR